MKNFKYFGDIEKRKNMRWDIVIKVSNISLKNYESDLLTYI